MKYSFVICLTLLIGGCSAIPEKLRVTEGTPLTPFAAVRAQPETNQGQYARWGGLIAKVVNNAESTMVEVVNFPLKSSAKPKQANETEGRFRLYYQGVLDPILYKEGKSITVLGKVKPSESGKIGEFEYQYPVLAAQAVHLWKDIKQINLRIKNNPYWHSPYYWHYNYGGFYGRTHGYRGDRNVYRVSKSRNTNKQSVKVANKK